ncbi:ATP-dependent Clp protease ATP-binding subunit ClpE [Plantibacter flavus]|uniref:ATP-dependent Clp protease ATP-binding subunit ClpE n=1 Tax=Plantibacter flavus TaxID=150123 RepID=A0A3N2BL66_9MICO|nr:AAA family ATPase [Plantibacter flavus]ROR76010.1 ATP-dependent Clp protease ATP-binding subunit ClpE [Plantibacter flavus]SMG49312.1 ATP-dependent Clp protease ATP-binding subunit ClpE [Plantibacter flavus]
MGLQNYSNPSDDDDTNGGMGGFGGPGSPGLPPMSGITGAMTDISDMLIDYNERFKGATPALFRDALIAQSISVLIGKAKPNPLLVGPAGVGKTRIVEEIARSIAVQSPLIPAQLAGSTVYELPLSNLVAGAGVVGQLEERVAALVDFATDKRNNAILFIDEIHMLQDSHDPIYKKVAQILKPALARGDMRLIGSTTMNEAKSFDDDPAFARRFSRLVVDELTREQTIDVLFAARGGFLSHYKNKVSVSDDVLTKVAVIADENSRASTHRPDNALTLLDRAMADTVVAHSSALATAQAANNAAVATALQSVTTLPLGESKLRSVAVRLMTGMATKEPFDEARVLSKLDRIKGQDSIVTELIDALRRDDLGAFPRKRPMAWMFAGPSGVGKTEASKIIAQELTNQPPIILNMGEYNMEHDASRLIGSGPGYAGSESSRELPFDTLESNPYRVILLDEVEKAHRVIHRLFLTALDEGWMRMANGKVVDFSKTIIIATTNAARDSISKNPVGFSTAPERQPLTRQELTKALQEHFEPEFLGRFSKLIAFAPLSRDTFTDILVASYERELDRIALSDPRTAALVARPIDVDVLEAAVTASYLPDQGARPAEQAARTLIEDAVLAVRFPSAPTTPGSTGSGIASDLEGPVDE